MCQNECMNGSWSASSFAQASRRRAAPASRSHFVDADGDLPELTVQQRIDARVNYLSDSIALEELQELNRGFEIPREALPSIQELYGWTHIDDHSDPATALASGAPVEIVDDDEFLSPLASDIVPQPPVSNMDAIEAAASIRLDAFRIQSCRPFDGDDGGGGGGDPSGNDSVLPRQTLFRNVLRRAFGEQRERLEKISRAEEEGKALVNWYDVMNVDPRNVKWNMGRVYFNLARDLYSQFGKDMEPSREQRQFFASVHQAFAAHLFKDDFETERIALLQEFGKKSFVLAAMILTMRRFGKTTAGAGAIAVFMYTGRGIDLLIIATTQAISAMMLNKVRFLFRRLPKSGHRFVTSSTKELHTSYVNEPESTSIKDLTETQRVNKAVATACTVQGNKGKGGGGIFVDEAARVPLLVFEEVVAPMCKVANTVLVCMSTALGAENAFSKFFDESNHEYDEIISRMHIELYCEDCKKAGKRPVECSEEGHGDYMHPHWLVASDKKRARLFMSSEAMFAQETMGVIMSSRACVYDYSWIKRFRDAPFDNLVNGGPIVTHTYVDPNGGGASDFALATIVRRKDPKQIVVVGYDRIAAASAPDVNVFVQRYFKEMRKHPLLRGAVSHIAYIENNFGGYEVVEANEERIRLGLMPPPSADTSSVGVVHHVQPQFFRDTPEKPGVYKNHYNTTSAVVTSIHDMFRDTFRRFEHPVHHMPDKKYAVEVESEMFTQIANLHKVVTRTGKWHYSGKMGGGAHQQPDDLWMCVYMAAYFSFISTAKETIMAGVDASNMDPRELRQMHRSLAGLTSQRAGF